MKGTSDADEPMFVWSSADIRRVAEPKRAPPAPPPAATGRQKRPRRASGTAKNTSSVDSRRFPRLDLKLPILYRILQGDAGHLPAAVRAPLLAQSKDISPIGLCLSLEEQLSSGSLLELTLHMVERREKFEALARVVWSRPVGDSVHFLTGLQFVVVQDGRLREERHAQMEALVRLLDDM
jgi:hypothetical protein